MEIDSTIPKGYTMSDLSPVEAGEVCLKLSDRLLLYMLDRCIDNSTKEWDLIFDYYNLVQVGLRYLLYVVHEQMQLPTPQVEVDWIMADVWNKISNKSNKMEIKVTTEELDEVPRMLIAKLIHIFVISGMSYIKMFLQTELENDPEGFKAKGMKWMTKKLTQKAEKMEGNDPLYKINMNTLHILIRDKVSP